MSNIQTVQSGVLDIENIRSDFPILARQVYGKPLVYLDNAATTQKPQTVIDSIAQYYSENNSNVHRGVHFLSNAATEQYENARETVREFINAGTAEEIVFVRGVTEAVNLVAQTFGMFQLKLGDEVIISEMEHHSNIVPWQLLEKSHGVKLRVIPINDRGEIIMPAFEDLINERTKLVSIVYVSNSLGTINPVKEMIEKAHSRDIPVFVDGAQAVQHSPVDVRALDCDFFAFSGHKVFGPTGIGALYGKRELLDSLPPYQGGGDMIKSVTFEKTVYNELPYKFEAGTPNIAGAIGMATALDYVSAVGIDRIAEHEAGLLAYATQELGAIEGLNIIGTASKKTSVLSFTLDGIHPHDIGTILDREGVAIRTGHHCTQPVMLRFKVPATARASMVLYNTMAEIDMLTEKIRDVIKVFA